MTEQVLKGMEGVLQLATNGTTSLMDEALNLFIVLAVLDILKFAAVFVVFYIAKKFLDSMGTATEDAKTKRIFHAGKTAGLMLSIIFFVAHSYAGALTIAKIMVAPNLFLIEKGYHVLKEVKDGK